MSCQVRHIVLLHSHPTWLSDFSLSWAAFKLCSKNGHAHCGTALWLVNKQTGIMTLNLLISQNMTSNVQKWFGWFANVKFFTSSEEVFSIKKPVNCRYCKEWKRIFWSVKHPWGELWPLKLWKWPDWGKWLARYFEASTDSMPCYPSSSHFCSLTIGWT